MSFNCPDIDECLSSPCNSNATCRNTPGNFTCACNKGFSGNGLTCNGKYETSSNLYKHFI